MRIRKRLSTMNGVFDLANSSFGNAEHPSLVPILASPQCIDTKHSGLGMQSVLSYSERLPGISS